MSRYGGSNSLKGHDLKLDLDADEGMDAPRNPILTPQAAGPKDSAGSAVIGRAIRTMQNSPVARGQLQDSSLSNSQPEQEDGEVAHRDADDNEPNRQWKNRKNPQKIKKLIASMTIKNAKLGGVLTPLHPRKGPANERDRQKESEQRGSQVN